MRKRMQRIQLHGPVVQMAEQQAFTLRDESSSLSRITYAPLAQRTERRPSMARDRGSIPLWRAHALLEEAVRLTALSRQGFRVQIPGRAPWPHRLMAKLSSFQDGEDGSKPSGAARSGVAQSGRVADC